MLNEIFQTIQTSTLEMDESPENIANLPVFTGFLFARSLLQAVIASLIPLSCWPVARTTCSAGTAGFVRQWGGCG